MMTLEIVTAADRGLDRPGHPAEGAFPFSRRELFWRARYLRQDAGLPHLPFLFWLVSEMRPRRAVTLGVTSGVLHFALCQAVDKIGSDTLCHGLGAWSDEDGAAGPPEGVVAHNADHYGDFSSLAATDDEHGAGRFADGSVDLLIVEGPPAGAGLESVARSWLPRLSERGVVFLPGADGLDREAAERFGIQRGPQRRIRLEHGGGLTVLLTGAEQPERIERLAALEADSPGEVAIHRLLARLGTLHVDEWRARHESARADGLAASLERMVAEREGLDDERAALAKRLAELGDAYELRHERVARAEAALCDLREDLGLAREALARAERKRRTDVRALTLACEAAKEAAIKVQTTLRRAEAKIVKRGDRIASLIAERKALVAERKALKRERDALVGERDALVRGRDALVGERDALVGGRGELEKALRTTRAGRTAERDATIKALIAQRDALRQDRDALLCERGELLASTSWRITSPLRRLGSTMRRSR